jgi:hypothetical protein
MKNLVLATLFFFTCITLFAQADFTNITSAKTGITNSFDTTGMAKIYIIRSTGHVGSAVNLRVWVDSVMMCKVRNNRYAMFYVQPGMHAFNASSWDMAEPNSKIALKMPVEAGKTYYMSIHIKQRFFGIEISVDEITYNTAAPQLEKYKRDECE